MLIICIIGIIINIGTCRIIPAIANNSNNVATIYVPLHIILAIITPIIDTITITTKVIVMLMIVIIIVIIIHYYYIMTIMDANFVHVIIQRLVLVRLLLLLPYHHS